MNLKTISPLVITILISICSSAQPSAPCKRLLMSGLENSAIFPWIQLSGLYHLYDVPNATFPLYKHDLQDMFFYYNTTAKRFEIKPAEWISKGWQPVLGALTSGSYIVTSPQLLIFISLFDRKMVSIQSGRWKLCHTQRVHHWPDVCEWRCSNLLRRKDSFQPKPDPGTFCTIHVFHVYSICRRWGGLTIPLHISQPSGFN